MRSREHLSEFFETCLAQSDETNGVVIQAIDWRHVRIGVPCPKITAVSAAYSAPLFICGEVIASWS